MVLLLGATGLLGQNVLRLLLERGIPVRALVRSQLVAEGVEIIQGNILDKACLLEAAAGCDSIINCAGSTDMRIPSLEGFRPMNRDLPILLANVLLEADVPVLINVSTSNTIDPGTPEKYSDESAPIGAPFDKSPYALSKLEGEKALTEFASAHPEKRIVILNPGFLLGPFGGKKLSSGTLMLAAWRKPLMIVPSGGKSFLNVKDAATAVVNALEKGEGRYLLTGKYLSLKDFYKLQAKVMDYRQWIIVLPDFVVKAAGFLGDIFKKLGLNVSFYSHNLNQLLAQEWYDCSRARKELDYPQSPLEDAVREFFDWYLNRQ